MTSLSQEEPGGGRHCITYSLSGMLSSWKNAWVNDDVMIEIAPSSSS